MTLSRRRFLANAALSSIGALVVPARAAGTPERPCSPLLSHRFPRLQDGAPQDLCQYAGNAILVVNTASYCGFTKQYQGLEALHARFRDRGFVVLGFPSNDFGGQEPGDAKDIANLCFNTYGVSFPMFAKTVVSGAKANPFYAELARLTGQPPQWNFHKYLIARDGRSVLSFPSQTAPESEALQAAVRKALAGAAPR